MLKIDAKNVLYNKLTGKLDIPDINLYGRKKGSQRLILFLFHDYEFKIHRMIVEINC